MSLQKSILLIFKAGLEEIQGIKQSYCIAENESEILLNFYHVFFLFILCIVRDVVPPIILKVEGHVRSQSFTNSDSNFFAHLH